VLEKKEKAKQQSHMNWILSMIEQGEEKDLKDRFKEGVKAHTSHPPPKVHTVRPPHPPQCYQTRGSDSVCT
jgi:hypothetical protein